MGLKLLYFLGSGPNDEDPSDVSDSRECVVVTESTCLPALYMCVGNGNDIVTKSGRKSKPVKY